jgi:hypothetical protein
MKKNNTRQLALRTQTVATLTTRDLRAVAGGTLSTNIGVTSQLSNAGWSTIVESNAGWSTIIY